MYKGIILLYKFHIIIQLYMVSLTTERIDTHFVHL